MTRGREPTHAMSATFSRDGDSGPRACSSSRSSRQGETGPAIRRTSTTATRFRSYPTWRRPIITDLSPPQGFAFQRIYTDDGSLDETLAVGDGDVVRAARLSPRWRAARLRSLLFECDGRPKAGVALPQRPRHEWAMKSA